jgi:small subunit ribosomal protein S14
MASKGIVNRDNRRRELHAKFAARRAELKRELKKSWNDPQKGYIRRFGLSRITMREYAHLGLLPGVTKSSW